MKTTVLLLVLAILAGCSTLFPPGPELPVGVGRGTDELKPSRCACELIYIDGRHV